MPVFCDRVANNAEMSVTDRDFINSASKILLQLWLESELERWESVGLGWAFLRTLPETAPERTESDQFQAPLNPEGQSSGQPSPTPYRSNMESEKCSTEHKTGQINTLS